MPRGKPWGIRFIFYKKRWLGPIGQANAARKAKGIWKVADGWVLAGRQKSCMTL